MRRPILYSTSEGVACRYSDSRSGPAVTAHNTALGMYRLELVCSGRTYTSLDTRMWTPRPAWHRSATEIGTSCIVRLL